MDWIQTLALCSSQPLNTEALLEIRICNITQKANYQTAMMAARFGGWWQQV